MSDDQLTIICGTLLIFLVFLGGIGTGMYLRETQIRHNAEQVQLISPLSY